MFRLRKFIVPVLFVAVIFSFQCSKDEGNPVGPENEDAYLWVHFEGDSTRFDFADMEMIDITALSKTTDENDAIWLSAFIDTARNPIPEIFDRDDVLQESRELYAYRMVGDDGFSAHEDRGYPDNSWEEMSMGYVLVDIRRVIFPDDIIDLPGAYNVSDVRHIEMYRKVDVVTPDSSKFVELYTLGSVQVANDDGEQESALPLKDMVEAVLTAPDGFGYQLEAVDGYVTPDTLTWTELQTGHWLLESQKTWFQDATYQTGKYKVKYLKSIHVIP